MVLLTCICIFWFPLCCAKFILGWNSMNTGKSIQCWSFPCNEIWWWCPRVPERTNNRLILYCPFSRKFVLPQWYTTNHNNIWHIIKIEVVHTTPFETKKGLCTEILVWITPTLSWFLCNGGTFESVELRHGWNLRAAAAWFPEMNGLLLFVMCISIVVVWKRLRAAWTFCWRSPLCSWKKTYMLQAT